MNYRIKMPLPFSLYGKNTVDVYKRQVFDKTGTLTIGKPVVTDVATQQDEHKVLTFAAMLEQGSKHPLATAILTKAEELQLSYETLSHVQTHNGLGLSTEMDDGRLLVGSRKFMQEMQIATAVYEAQEQTYLQSGKTCLLYTSRCV